MSRSFFKQNKVEGGGKQGLGSKKEILLKGSSGFFFFLHLSTAEIQSSFKGIMPRASCHYGIGKSVKIADKFLILLGTV